jgi:hypothetical protein
MQWGSETAYTMSISTLQWVKWARIFKFTPHSNSDCAKKTFRKQIIVEIHPQLDATPRIDARRPPRPNFFSSFFLRQAPFENHLISRNYERMIKEAINKHHSVDSRL